MLARFRVLLPYELHLDSAAVFPPFEWQDGESWIRVYPPERSIWKDQARDPGDIKSAAKGLGEAASTNLGPVFFAGGGRGMAADRLQIEVRRDTFDRRDSGGSTDLEDLFFAIANNLLERLRLVTRCPWIAQLDSSYCPWQIQYLTDEGDELPKSEGLRRGLLVTPVSLRIAALTADAWQHASSNLRSVEVSRSAVLWLDAVALLPRVGPSLVLAAAAIETRIEDVLSGLVAKSAIPAALWQWLTDRGDFRKNPSTDEQLTVLLQALAGKSLKDEPALWEAHSNIRSARNSYLHEGVVKIGRSETPVTKEVAQGLLRQCERILEWLDRLLPEDGHALPSKAAAQWARAWGTSFKAEEFVGFE